jgi:hypothetical protein
MTEQPDRALGLARPALPPQDSVTGLELVALAISLIWLVFSGLFFLFSPGTETSGTVNFIMTLFAIFMPVAMIWVAAMATRSARTMREESRRLQAAVDGMRATYLADRNARAMGVAPQAAATVERKLTEIAQATRATEAALATFTTTREAARPRTAPRAAAPVDDQPSLIPAEDAGPPLMRVDLIRALNFPDTEKDEAGFAALRRALKDRNAKALVHAAQDVLTLLSQDGIYMDDLSPDRARPDVWRRFARGERGRSVAALGGIRDRSCLALAIGRMREDTIFRDAGHHFLRLFDRTLVQFEPEATDEDIAALAETRTARAFMLLGRVTGAFD